MGKSLLAREIHNHSMLSGLCNQLTVRRFRLNCWKANFSDTKKGFYRCLPETRKSKLASGGTLFIDEIELQQSSGKAFTLYQSGEYEMLGSTGVIHSDARVIAATNRDLKNETAQKRFEEGSLLPT